MGKNGNRTGRCDYGQYEGVKITRLEGPVLQVENDSNRAFRVETMAGPRVIAPGSSKMFEIPGETFAAGWDFGAQIAIAPAEQQSRFTSEEIEAMKLAGVPAYEINKISGPALDEMLEAAERMRLEDGDALFRAEYGSVKEETE